jgi:hypothetical protein
MTCRRWVPLVGLLVLLFGLSCNSIFAPDQGDLRGSVTDDRGRALTGAAVTAGGRTVTTGSGGGYSFSDLPAGNQTVTASKAGYGSRSVRADLPETGGLSCDTPSGRAPAIALTLEGWGEYAAGLHSDAAQSFREVLAADPQCADAQNGLGWACARMDSLETSRAALQAALALEPGFPDALAGLAFVSSALHDHDTAITSASALLASEGDDYVFWRDAAVTSSAVRLVLARSLFHRGDYDLAQAQIDLLDPANGLDPAVPATWVVGGAAYASYEEALLVELDHLGA